MKREMEELRRVSDMRGLVLKQYEARERGRMRLKRIEVEEMNMKDLHSVNEHHFSLDP